MPTWRSIDQATDGRAAQVPLVQGVLERVAVLILDSCGCVVEKYVVQLRARARASHARLTARAA